MGHGWDEALIEERTQSLIDDILAVWPVPAGHSSAGRHGGGSDAEATVQDLVRAGLLTPGQILVAQVLPHARATVTADGLLEVEGGPAAPAKPSPSGAPSTGGGSGKSRTPAARGCANCAAQLTPEEPIDEE